MREARRERELRSRPGGGGGGGGEGAGSNTRGGMGLGGLSKSRATVVAELILTDEEVREEREEGARCTCCCGRGAWDINQAALFYPSV